MSDEPGGALLGRTVLTILGWAKNEFVWHFLLTRIAERET
jgi:hypothetical protein